jgi:hypothetical protein
MSLGWFLLGGAAWTASEYAIHRFVGHGPKRTPAATRLGRLTPRGLAAEFNREHLAHHTDPSYFAPTERKVLAAAATVPAIAAVLAPVIGPRRALSFAGGFAVTYGAYEVLHRRVHTHPPRGAYGRWLRRNHLHHHHRTPRANHGVTTPFWDHVALTHQPPERLRVPRRSAPPWLVGDDGRVRPELAADYELVGAGAREGRPREEGARPTR